MLRLFQTDDLPLLAELRRDRELQDLLLAYPDEIPPDDASIECWITRRTNDPDGCFRVIADEAGATLGFAQLACIHHQGRFGYFGIALARHARGKGVGIAAVKSIIALAKSQGLTKLLAEIRSDNRASMAMCESVGFKIAGVLKEHYKGFDVTLLELLL